MAEHVQDKPVVIASYTPDQAGKRIGWISTEAKNNVGQYKDVDLVELTIGVASVSDKGAQRGYTLRTEEDQEKPTTFPKDVTGFENASELRLEIIRGMSVKDAVEMRGIDLAAAAHNRDASRMVSGAGQLENVMWAEDPDELLAELKRRLADEDVRNYYDVIYYGLNVAIGHVGVRESFRNLISTEQDPTFVADPEMHETTRWQLANARSVAVNLEQIADEDERMRQRLTVYSELDASELPAAFQTSREIVHAAEARARDAATKKLVIPRYVFLPPGFRSAGRVWPYMDASLDVNDERAFGRELEALRNRKVELPNYELDREINETGRRLEYARAAVQMLRGLLAAEKLASAV